MIKFQSFIIILALLLAGLQSVDAEPTTVEIQKSDWHGFERQSFSISGHTAYVVVPHTAAPGKPWVWRVNPPDYDPEVDLELARDGYHIGYIEDSDNSPELADRFYAQVRSEWGLAEKMAVEAFGDEGVIALHYVARHPECVACIVGDSPVMDLKKDSSDELRAIAKAKIAIRRLIQNKDGGHPFPVVEVDATVRFIMDHSDVLPKGKEYFQLRDGLANCRWKFENEKAGRVAFLGGSITFNPGWREEVMRYLQKRFSQTRFEFVAAGIPSLGSVPHAFRLERDVLSHGPIDLLFVEAAVNDGSNIPDQPELMLKGMEGVIRHGRTVSPKTDIVQMHFVMPPFIADYNAGKTSAPLAEHEKVAEAYGCTSLNLALEVTDRIDAGEFTWADFADIHPSPFGQRVYANSMMRMLDAAWSLPPATAIKPHPLPKIPLDATCFSTARFGKLADVRLGSGFKLVPDWKPTVAVDTRDGFVHVPALVATAPGSEFTFSFDGNAAGILIGAGPDTGIIEASIDGGPTRRIDTFTPWSRGLYLPWAIMLCDGLKQGHHTVNLKVAADHNSDSTGTALYVFQLLLN